MTKFRALCKAISNTIVDSFIEDSVINFVTLSFALLDVLLGALSHCANYQINQFLLAIVFPIILSVHSAFAGNRCYLWHWKLYWRDFFLFGFFKYLADIFLADFDSPESYLYLMLLRFNNVVPRALALLSAYLPRKYDQKIQAWIISPFLVLHAEECIPECVYLRDKRRVLAFHSDTRSQREHDAGAADSLIAHPDTAYWLTQALSI